MKQLVHQIKFYNLLRRSVFLNWFKRPIWKIIKMRFLMFVTTMVYLFWTKMISVPNLIYSKDLIWKKTFLQIIRPKKQKNAPKIYNKLLAKTLTKLIALCQTSTSTSKINSLTSSVSSAKKRWPTLNRSTLKESTSNTNSTKSYPSIHATTTKETK